MDCRNTRPLTPRGRLLGVMKTWIPTSRPLSVRANVLPGSNRAGSDCCGEEAAGRGLAPLPPGLAPGHPGLPSRGSHPCSALGGRTSSPKLASEPRVPYWAQCTQALKSPSGEGEGQEVSEPSHLTFVGLGLCLISQASPPVYLPLTGSLPGGKEGLCTFLAEFWGSAYLEVGGPRPLVTVSILWYRESGSAVFLLKAPHRTDGSNLCSTVFLPLDLIQNEPSDPPSPVGCMDKQASVLLSSLDSEGPTKGSPRTGLGCRAEADGNPVLRLPSSM